jgi:hypothetical protein
VDDGLDRTVEPEGQHASGALLREPQAALVPARALGEQETVEQDVEPGFRHFGILI